MQVDPEKCHVYDNTHQYFGSSGYGITPLCDLGYPRIMQPDPCIIEILNKNTPTHKFGTRDDVVSVIQISLFAGTALTFLGVATACHLKNKNKQNAASEHEILNEETDLNPQRLTMQ
jgi:hypothetical protein